MSDEELALRIARDIGIDHGLNALGADDDDI